jgi:DNA adenine methylase
MIKPFLRWAGGKTKLVKYLLTHLPLDFNNRNYVEPFLGAGSLFFATKPKYAIISDLNQDLINCYIQIKNNPEDVYYLLNIIVKKHSKENYYSIREEFNNKNNLLVERAAQFIYLNKTSFNGIFRVNLKGNYNVPYGNIDNPSIVSFNEIIEISNYLKNAKIINNTFTKLGKYADNSSFFYLDPPYPPINGTSFFTHYTKERFADEDQLLVKIFANKLSNKNAKVLISNADTPLIRELYKDWIIHKVSTTRWISSQKNKYKINELLIKNYDN